MPRFARVALNPRDRGLAAQSLEAFALNRLICAKKSKANSLEKGISLFKSFESRVYNENSDRLSPSALTNDCLSPFFC
jgi:hypothetical protein